MTTLLQIVCPVETLARPKAFVVQESARLIVQKATVFIMLPLSNRFLILRDFLMVLLITKLGDGDKCLAMW